MAVRWYLLPIETDGNRRAPKYLRSLQNPAGLDVPWGMMDYGLMPVCVAWCDVTNAQHTSLMANTDVRFAAMHANLDNPIGSTAATNVRAVLEALHIPGQWVQGADTWRNILRTTCGLFQFAQRVHGLWNVRALPEGYTLATTWSELPDQARNFLRLTAEDLGIDTSGATGSTTLRQIFKAFADAWGDRPIYIGGIEL